MKKIIIGWIIIAIISFLALMKVASGQDSPCRCNILLSDRLVEAKWNPILMTEIYQRIKIGTLVNTLKTKPTKRHWFVTADTTSKGNFYAMEMNIKENDVKLFYFFIQQGKFFTSFYYHPDNQVIFIKEFTYKKPYDYENSGFVEWKNFWLFKDNSPDEAYYLEKILGIRPSKMWSRVLTIGIVPLSVMREIVDISDKY